ncbi:hypothetical protein [Nonomuraea coxensis]|uniref:hypothetical protein n=1 Tax=Nonomuraea coxensis TaxID=404386 RepID=UPI000377F1E9|nr:hypothetical protein [Nonomuraea coxensis]
MLTVLLCPPDNEDPSSPTWSGLRQRVYDNLMTYQNRGLVILRKVDRPFHWVNHDLYTIDLYGIPTLIVQFSVDHKRLGIHLGGCHVSAETVHEMSRVHAMTFPSLDEWSKDTSALAGLAAEPPADEHDLLELNHDLATRLVTICVVVAVDTYYLQRRRAYVEQFDEAVAAAGIFGDDWPADLGVNSALVADPAFHLLHRAQRKVRRGLKDEAIEDVNRALRVLSGVKSEAERRALRLMREALGSASTEEHHKAKLREVFESFPEHDQLRLESLDLLSESLLTDQGQPEEPAAESPAEPVALPPAPVSPVPPPAPRPLLGRSGWTQRANRNPLDD